MENPFPPFEPDNNTQPRNHKISWRRITPNFITLIALCAGLTSIRMSLEHNYSMAIAAIGLAIILDGLDGRVARFLKASSKFGAELDSLADFVNFGVSPAILIYVMWLELFSSIGWIVILIYTICTALRLARFNCEIDKNEQQPGWKKAFAVGVPAPAGAFLLLLPAYLYQLGFNWPFGALPIMLYTCIIALLLVSRLPTFSGKHLNSLPREFVIPLFLITIVLLGLLLSFPWQVLSITAFAYLASLPLSLHSYNKHKTK